MYYWCISFDRPGGDDYLYYKNVMELSHVGILKQALKDGMLADWDLASEATIRPVTKEEYLEHMWD